MRGIKRLFQCSEWLEHGPWLGLRLACLSGLSHDLQVIGDQRGIRSAQLLKLLFELSEFFRRALLYSAKLTPVS